MAVKSQQEERTSDAALGKGRTAMSLPGSETGAVFLSNFDGVWGTEPRLPCVERLNGIQRDGDHG